MLKVLGFVKRNSKLSHDEYRAGHVGYHNSFGRRLNHIRGYLLNVASNTPVVNSLGKDLVHRLTRNEPDPFDNQWDGWGQLMFDTFEDYLAARSPARDFPGELGLQMDPMVGKLGDDLDELYAGTPFQFQVEEFISRPVVRPERKLFKLVQFGQRPVELPIELFRAYWTGRYASLASTMPGLRGLIINFRTPLDVMSKFFAPDAEGLLAAANPSSRSMHWSKSCLADCSTERWMKRWRCCRNEIQLPTFITANTKRTDNALSPLT